LPQNRDGLVFKLIHLPIAWESLRPTLLLWAQRHNLQVIGLGFLERWFHPRHWLTLY
jgi:hypothetical protein